MPLQAEGEFALVKSKLEPALELSGQPVKRGTMAHEHIVYMMLVDSAAITRDQAAILKYAPILEELSTRDNHQPYLAIACRAFGVAHRLAEDYELAESKLHQALEIFGELEMPWQRGRTFHELGELAQLRGDLDLTRQLFIQALDEFEKIQAIPDLEKTKVIFEKILE
ncbi:MAG: hypothetical protein IZT55_05460 [Anaerolineae bacterium]|nr:hypothetical protein [Anaerolineae bacterium]